MVTKILGLDLGTNSIGWAIRDTDPANENQIVDYGVTVYKKGVGDGKSGEFSLAAERRKNRSKRRLYNAKRYRKWELLKVLIENDMCPLRQEELRLWSVGNWQNKKNEGRQYPLNNDAWKKWLAIDPIYFGDKGLSDNKKVIRKSPYDLRCELIESFEKDEQVRKYKIGRSLYHLVQRRGFKTSRKSGKSSYGESELLKKFYEKYPDKADWKVSQVFNYLKSDKCNDTELKLIRIRKDTGVLQRKYYEDELIAICEKQKISKDLIDKLHHAIYYVRGPHGQKGLVGKCTLESAIKIQRDGKEYYLKSCKPRIPISHPAFEEFRALQFINNIKWRGAGTKKAFEPIPMILKKKIFEEMFFKKSLPHFKFKNDKEPKKDISNRYSEYEGKRYEFNFDKSDPSVSTCPVIAGIMDVFDEEWKNKFIADENKFGINWAGLVLSYNVKYDTKKENGKGLKRKGKGFIVKTKKERTLDYEGIWHLLFDFIQTRDKDEELKQFCLDVLGWTKEKADKFAEINVQQGYGSLSKNAIVKILPYLQEGYIYSEAVSFANLSKVLGKEKFLSNKETVKKFVADVIKKIDKEKEKLNIVNGLIQKYSGNIETIKAKRLDDKIKTNASVEVETKLKSFFGEDNWNSKSSVEKKEYFDFVLGKYKAFLNRAQKPNEKASSLQGKNPDMDYYKLPRLDGSIKQTLKDKFSATDDGLKHLYHPSDIEIYPRANTKRIVDKHTGEIKEVPQLGDPQPTSKGFKNPMAMRTMYELRKLINYLLEVGKIDKETKIVIEIARLLNDANYRKAYSDWIADREKENEEYAKAIADMYDIANISIDDFNKFKSAVEQITNNEFSEGLTKEFEKKYREFIKTFLIGEKKDKQEQNPDEEVIEDSTTEIADGMDYEYLMYLILNRDNFVQLLNSKIPNSNKFIRQIIKTSKGFSNKRNALKEMLTKYRLWNEQKFQCFYTGQQIPFTRLFSNDYQIEHTIPRSISFDSELKNLTVCDAIYNKDVKNNSFPTQCPNYEKIARCKTIKGEIECSPIKERVDRLIKPKVDELKSRIQNLKAAAKNINDWEVDKKNANIRLRHYLQFEKEYWEKKYLTFSVKRDEWKDNWKNSQLVDTQIITKYARAYMKSLFNRVEVQKAGVVSEFKKIYQLKGDEQKDRTRHSHHAMDAAVLTFIPGSARREDILKKYYTDLEKNTKFHIKPYPEFNISHITSIDENVLINHVGRDRTLNSTYKKVRKRGIVQFNKDENGNKVPLIMQGDSMRRQLHDETFFGSIKVKQSNGEYEEWLVARKPVDGEKKVDIDKDRIIDQPLRQHIMEQIKKGKKINEVVDFQGKRIRHIRCTVNAGRPRKDGTPGVLRREKAIELRKNSLQPKQEHKKYTLVKNSNEGNFLFLVYEKEANNMLIREARIINLFEFRNEYRFSSLKEIWNDRGLNQTEDEIPLKYILKVGYKAIFYSESKEELKEIDEHELKKRVFVIYKFNESGTPDIYLKNNIDARPNPEIDKLCENSFDPNKYQAGLSLKAARLNCIFEGKDFEIKPDGQIIFK